MVEYYTWYDDEDSVGTEDIYSFLLVKVDRGFYYYDVYTNEWVDDNLYDDYCSSFTEDWRNKSIRVVAISYDKAMALVEQYKKIED